MTSEAANNVYQQQTDLQIIKLLSPYLTTQTFLDIGADNGDFTRFFSECGLKGIFFEPLPQRMEQLQQLAHETGCTFSSYAIDASDRIADFYQAYDKNDEDSQYFSSLHPLENDERINHKKVCTVECRSLNSLLKEGMIEPTIGVIKIDTEGNDLKVLQGMSGVSAEILVCEFFMPNIYAGWELGHPKGLIAQAKQLGFNHFFSIKRISEFEFVSLNNDIFIDKQWGNLIFIADKIYHQAQSVIENYIFQKENEGIQNCLNKVFSLQASCDEKQKVITEQFQEMAMLRQVCDERLACIDELNSALLDKIIKKKKNFWSRLIRS